MEFRVLGPLEVRRECGVVPLGGVKPRMVIAVLLMHANEAVHPERLALALWGEDAPPTAVKSLYAYVSRLRAALGGSAVLARTPGGYRLRVGPGELDADRFEGLVAEGRRALAANDAEQAATVLREALALWRGRPLADLALDGFTQPYIERLEEQRLAAVELRVEADLAVGRHRELIGELRELVAANPTRERFAGQLMLSLYRCGQQTDALDVFQSTRRRLIDEIGVEAGPDLYALQHAILAHDPRLDAEANATTPPQDGAGALPVPVTELFGRERDLDAIADLMRTNTTRLVTLLGPGGVGKTRLAIEAARRLATGFAGGARFVSLASVTQPGDLASAIVRALAVPVRDGEAPDIALKRFLNVRHLLLVLDNLEHLMGGTPLIAELLDACGDLTVLTTSREPTRLSAERLYPVRPLEVPATQDAVSAHEIARFGAVAMFVDRVRARDPDFNADQTNASELRAICLRLDGLPLAIELAAARIGLLSLGELAARLDRTLAALGAGARDAPARQRTLRATIEWSFNLLTPPERAAFKNFAVFVGGATVPTAETVTRASLDTLDSLVAKQLLVRRGERLLMLETVREYALERLGEDPQAQLVYDQHAAWCLGFARDATPHLGRSDRLSWLARLDAELSNLLSALARTLKDGRSELALRLAVELGAYWWRTNQRQAGLPWIDAAIDRSQDASAHARATALLVRARLRGRRKTEAFTADVWSALKLFRACDDDAGITACLRHMADVESWQGRFEDAEALAEQALGFAQRAGDEEAIALALMQQTLAARGYEATSQRAHTALGALRHLDDLSEAASICTWTGYTALLEHRYRDALAWLSEGLDVAAPLRDPEIMFHLRSNQGLAWLFLDELDQATSAFAHALEVCREASAEHLVDETLLGVAAVAAARGQLARAARIAGAAERHKTIALAHGEVTIRLRLHELLTTFRNSYKAAQWNRATADAASLTVYEAIALAQESEPVTSADRSC